MKSIVFLGLIVAATSSLAAVPELATKKNCMTCHAEAKPLVGPSYKDVAAKYASQKDAVDYLAGKIQKGSNGVWKMAMPMMPPNQVTEAEAKELATWVMSHK